MGPRPLKVLIVVFVYRCFSVETGNTTELLARWSLDELENGHFVESQGQNASSTLLLARDGATHTRTGVLTVQDVNYLSVSVPNGDCLVNKTACGEGLVVSFWMKLKGFLSEVISDRDHYQTVLKRWLDTVIDPNLRWINCYRASEHGWNASIFHARCDFKGPSVTLVRIKNFVFGGFTDQDWGGSPGPRKSRDSFLFLLSNDSDKELSVKLDIKNLSHAIHNDPCYGPWFGNGDLVISDMAAYNINSSSNLGEAYSLPDGVTYGSDEAGNYLAGSRYFMPEEVEVFHVECFHPLGMTNGEISNGQITQVMGNYTNNRAPWQARLNNSPGNTWIPESKKAKLVIDLGSLRRILAVDAHGNRNASNPRYPTKFGFSNGSSSQGWTSFVKDLTLDDESSIKRFIFLPSVVTRKLLVHTEDCHAECAFAMEIYGCSAGSCQEELPIKKFTASSFAPSHEPSKAHFKSSSCWKPSGAANGIEDYLEVDLGMVKVLSAITMLAKINIQFNLQYSTEGISWKHYPDFSGSTKVFTVEGMTSVSIKPMVQARFLRVYPITNNDCFRIKLSGCTSFKGTDTAIMSSGRYPFNETGLLISNSAKALRRQYHSTKDGHVETKHPFTSMNWTRVTFRLTRNYDTFIHLNNKKVDQDNYCTAAHYESNSARVLNLASMSSWGNVSSTQMWAVENIQLSDVSLWIKSDGGDFPENTLPAMLDKCNFDDSPCSWKIGNWTKRRGRVPSEGTGPCHLADCANNGFYIHLESSYPRSKGDSIRFESPFVVPAYKCLSFKYHMWGKHVGRLTVYTQSGKHSNLVAKWRLSGDQGNSWNTVTVQLQQYRPFKLTFEAVVGDGFLGDIALDDVILSTVTCDHSPDYTKSYFQAPTLEKSAIIGHLSTLKSSLLGKLRTAHGKNNAWVPCYRALVDGRDIERFYSKCGEEKETVTILRVNNYIFGGYTDVGWSEVREKGVAVSKSAFLFGLKTNDLESFEIFPLKHDKRHEAQRVRPHEGPTFGDGDLSLKTLSIGSSQTGNSFENWHGLSLFADADDFNISDIEVLYPKDSLCKEPCNHHEGHCDEITTKCVCDWTERNVEWCLEGDPKKIINLYHDAASYWPLDSVEDLKDRARLGWGQAHGAVSLVAKGLSGQAIQLDGASGWVDLRDLGTLCQIKMCTDDFSISMWMKYYSKGNGENQTFLHFDNGLKVAELFYEATSKLVGVSLSVGYSKFSYRFPVAKGFWTHLGFSWKNDERTLIIQKNGETLQDVLWQMCHSCSSPSANLWSLTLGAGCFPNASFYEIAVWTIALGKKRFAEIYNTYRGPRRLNAQLSLQFTGISWRDDFYDPESGNFTALGQILRNEIITFYSSMQDVQITSEHISLSKCWNDGGLVSCNLTLHYYSEGYKQFGFLLDDWIPRANLSNVSGIILLRSRNDNVPSTPVSGLKARAASPYSVEVSWNTPSDEDIPGILVGYVVYYKKTSIVSNNWRKKEVNNAEGPYPNFTITSLKADTTYTVNVSTVSLEGEGKSASINVATDEIVLVEAPVIRSVESHKPTSCTLYWDPVLDDQHRKVLRGYRIVYNSSKHSMNPLNVTTNSSRTNFTVRGLKPYTYHSIKIAGFTLKGDGNYSGPVKCLTMEDRPSHPPTNQQVYDASSKSCDICWGPVPKEYKNGVIIGFEIQYFKDHEGVSKSKRQNISSVIYSYRLTGLDIYTKYHISVVGRTSAGPGNHSSNSRMICTTKADYPSASPTVLSAISSTPHSCQVTWEGIPSEFVNGELFFYEVNVVKNDSADQNSVDDYGTAAFVCKNVPFDVTINLLHAFTSYNIKVAAHNNIGRGKFSEAVECLTNETAPPLPPQNIRGHNISAQSIMVKWDPVPESDRNGVVREYHIRYGLAGNPHELSSMITDGSLCKVLTGLKPFSNYSFEVAAKTVAFSNYSEPIIVPTGELAPTTSPKITDFYNTSARSIFVKWRRPPEPIQGVLRGYRIIYKNLNNSQREDQYSTVDANTLFFEIRELEINSKYEIRVLAFTVADGNESEPVVVFTDSKVLPPPDRVPENLGLSNKTSTSCVLFWDGVTNSYSDPDGAVVGYYIYYRKAGFNDTFDKLDVEEDNRTVFTVGNLEEYVEYEFSVVAYNIYGEGNASDTFHCKTEEDAPSSPPHNLRGVHVKPREATIEWDIPAEEDWNGIIRGFTIMYYRVDKGNSTAEYRHVTPSELNVQLTGSRSGRRKRATDFSWILSDLDEYTLYIIRILMYTIGNSEYSIPLKIRTAEAAPSSSPTEVSTVSESSTSLLVTWSQVPYEDRNGEIRGFVITYWLVDDPSDVQYVNMSTSTPSGDSSGKRAADKSFNYILTRLKIWTCYYVKVAAFTISRGPFSKPYKARTDEGGIVATAVPRTFPCLPPQYVTFDVPGLTSLLAKWRPVPEHCRNGIILGYRVKYRRLDVVSGERIENTTADILYAFLYDLDIFANYSIETVAFTSKGEGNSTLDLALPDNLGTKSAPTNLTAYNYTTTTSVNVTWGPIEDELILERILGYRVSYRAVRIGDKEVEEGDEPTYNITVRKDTFDVVLEGLDPYTRYQINVSGFSRKGDGPSAITAGDTCRCHKRLTTNYRLFPPYVNQFSPNHDRNISVDNMTGMLPQILNDLIVTCCQTCAAHGESYVDFMYNGTNGKAKRKSEREMKTLIEDSNDLSFPVYGWKWQENYGPDYRYIPLVESPGVAFIIIEPDDHSPAQRLLDEIFATWPYCVISSLLAAIAGIIMWFLDTKYNSQQFPRSFWCGSWNGFWWAFISMTTLGYGDKVPSAYISKLFAIFWILTGLVLMSILSGALTSAVSSFVVQTDLILYGTKVAVIHGTPEYRLAVTRNAIVDKDHPYETFSEVYDALIKKEVQGMLIDTYEAGTKRDQFKDPRIRIHTIYDYKSTYGVVLAGNSTKLLQCSKSYMQSHQDEMFEHIGKFIYTIKEDNVPESVEIASGLFDPKNNIFRSFAYTVAGVVSLAILLGLILEFRQWFCARQKEQLGDPDREKTKHLQEMRTSVEDFYRNFKTNYSQMTKRHRSQLKSLETRLQDNNMPSSRASWPWSKTIISGFFKGNPDVKTKSPTENIYENPEAFLY